VVGRAALVCRCGCGFAGGFRCSCFSVLLLWSCGWVGGGVCVFVGFVFMCLLLR